MTRSRFVLEGLVLSGLLIGLAMFVGGTAHAETGAKWLVNGKDVGDLLPGLTVKEIENKTGVISWSTKGGTKVQFLCTSTNFDTGGVLAANGGSTAGNVAFSGCVTLLNGVISSACKPSSPGKPLGEILSLLGKGLIVLDKLASGELTELIRVVPINAAGEVVQLFGKLQLGEECSIGEQVNVETTALGEGVWAKDVNGNTGFLTEQVTHLIVEALKKLRVLGQPAEVLGSTIVELAGAHAGMKWSGVPG